MNTALCARELAPTVLTQLFDPMPQHPQRQQRRAQVFAAREGDVRDFGEQVKTVAVLTTDGFGQQPARQVSRVDPMP